MFTYTDNLGFLPDYGARLFPEKTALIQEGLQLTYAELDARANRVAQSLLLAGVGRGDRVFMVFANDVRFAECLFGIMRAGAVAVPVNPNLSADALAGVLEDSGARVLLATASVGETASRLRQDRLCDLAVVLDFEGTGIKRYDAWLASAPSARPEVDTDPGDVCMQPYTSGSTGRPKGVLLSHEGLLRNLELVRHAAMLQADDRLLVSTPLFHLNASVSGLLPCLMAGGTAVVLPSFDPVAVIRAIDRHRCTYTQGVPAMYKLVLAQRDEHEGRDLSSMRFLTCGSAPMPKSLLDELGKVFPGITVVEGYGLSEGGPVTTLLPRWGTRKLGSIGLPLPGIETKLVADDGLTEVDPGEVGELWVRSPMNALGYHNLPEVTAQRFTDDGWLRTGDLIRADDDGFFYFVGRADDMFNVGGENVYPAEVEAVLIQHSGVRDVCVLPVPHGVKGEVPVAFVLPEAGATVTAADVKSFFLQRGPAYAHPRQVFVVERMPLAPTGKIDRKCLAQRAREVVSGEGNRS